MIYHRFIAWHKRAQAESRSRLERQYEDFEDYISFLVSLRESQDIKEHARHRISRLVVRIKGERMREAQQMQMVTAMSRRMSMRSLALAFRLWSDV